MPGTRNMFVGAAFAILGLVITGITYAWAPGGHFVVAYGAVIFGGLQFVLGLISWLAYVAKSPKSKLSHHADTGFRIIVRSMVAVAAADGQFGPNERALIKALSSSFVGPLEDTVLDSIFNQMKSSPDSIYRELEDVARQVFPEHAELAVQSAIMVGLADGEFSDAERAAVSRIATLLSVTGPRLDTCIQKARSFLAEIFAPAASPAAASGQ